MLYIMKIIIALYALSLPMGCKFNSRERPEDPAAIIGSGLGPSTSDYLRMEAHKLCLESSYY